METILETKGLTKSFHQQAVLKNLDMHVPKGCIYGFVGKNGAGKTTTMKLLLGLLKADAGEMEVKGTRVVYGNTTSNQYIGYLSDVPSFYEYMTAKEYLVFCSELLATQKQAQHQNIDELLDKVGLHNVTKKIGGYSRGMKQRLGIAQALIGKPDILICDEPTSALDPMGRREILSILLDIKEETTVLFSTHILSDVQDMCDYIGILEQGQLVVEGNIEELLKQDTDTKLTICFTTEEEVKRCQQVLPAKYKVLVQDTRRLVYMVPHEQDTLAIMYLLYQHKLVPQSFSLDKKTIEDIFLEVTK